MCRKKKKKNADETIFSVNFTYQDLTAMEEFLEAKQQEGLQLVDYTSSLMKFKKCEPSESRYSCEIFLDRNRPDFDKDFVEMCESGGWKYICTDNAGLYIFKTDDENVTDIMTDDKMKLSLIAKSVGRSAILAALLALAYIAVYYFLSYGMLFKSHDIMSSSLLISSAVIMATMLLSRIVDVVAKVAWFIKRKLEVKQGKKLRFNNLNDFETSKLYQTIGFIIKSTFDLIIIVLLYDSFTWWIVVFLATLLIVILVTIFDGLKNKAIKKSLKKNTVILIVISVIIVACSFAVSRFVLAPIPDDTALAEKMATELELEDDEIDVSKSRFAQYYDLGWEVKMYVSRFPKIKNSYFDYIMDFCGGDDDDYTMTQKEFGQLKCYEFENGENYKYAMVADFEDYVIYIRFPKDNTIEKLQTVLLNK